MGTKTLKCCGCKERFPAETMINLNGSRFHAIDCATAYAQAKGKKAIERSKAKAKRVDQVKRKADSKALRDFNRKDVRWQHKQTQPVFNRMRVLQEKLWFKERGLEPVCISCCKPIGGDQWCCGHFKTVGAQGALRYDPRNTYIQHNRYCNMYLSGDIGGTKTTPGYKQGLKNRLATKRARELSITVRLINRS